MGSVLNEHKRDQVEMHREVAEMYRRREGYAFAVEFQEERNDVLLRLAGTGAARALDLGCGTGVMLRRLAGRFGLVLGVDLSMEMLQGFRADGLAGRVGLARGDMGALPLADRSIDLVLCRSALHHMDDEVQVLKEVCRVLKDDGRLVVGEPANDFPPFRLARHLARRGKSYGKVHTIDRAYTRAQMRAMFAAAGLEVAREHRFGFVAYPLCDNPDLVPVLKRLPAGLARGVARVLRGLDRGLAHVPLLKNWSWYTMLEVRRASPSRTLAQR